MLASVFLVVKYFEYSHKFEQGLLPGQATTPAKGIGGMPHVFFGIYFVMTGLHGVHVLAGMIVIAWVFLRARQGRYGIELLHAGGERGALLAPGGPDLDLPLPPALPGQVRTESYDDK